MAVLHMKITTSTMPHTSEFFAAAKAVEQFYYSLLFSTVDSYLGQDEPWRTWVEQGFSAAIRQAPPGTARGDALVTSVLSDGKVIEVTASAEQGKVLEQVAEVIQAFGRQRAEEPTAARSEIVEKLLLAPVSQALESGGADTHISNAITEMLERAGRALTYRLVTSIEVSVGPSRLAS